MSDEKTVSIEGAQVTVDIPAENLTPNLIALIWNSYEAVLKEEEIDHRIVPIIKRFWYSGAIAAFNTVLAVNHNMEVNIAMAQMQYLKDELKEFGERELTVKEENKEE